MHHLHHGIRSFFGIFLIVLNHGLFNVIGSNFLDGFVGMSMNIQKVQQ